MTDGRHVIFPARSVAGELAVPGDKGISHRALLFGAGCEGTMSIGGLSSARDVGSTLHAVLALGKIRRTDASNSQLESFLYSGETPDFLKLDGRANWASWPATSAVDCGNSGTTMRLLMGILAGVPGAVTLTGDASLSSRPMTRVAEPLRRMGAVVTPSAAGTAPMRIEGGPLTGIRYELPVASAQVKSAVLLAGMRATGPTTVVEPVATRDHTERLLRFLGADLNVGDRSIEIQATELFGDKEINIPGDFSSASFLLTAAAMLPGGDVRVTNLGLNPTRTAYLDVLERFGARVETGDIREESGEPRGWVRVRTGDRRPPWVAPAEIASCIDELPLVAVLGALAEGTTEVHGASELRVKESDRIATIVEGLVRMGVKAEAHPDGFTVEGGRIGGGAVDSHGDHRIAMALAVAGLCADAETVIDGWDAVDVSYPEFEEDLARLVT